MLVSYESSYQRKSKMEWGQGKMEWNLETQCFDPSRGQHCLCPSNSGEALKKDKKEDLSTYEDPGLAVGGGPEEMKEKQKKQSVWVIGGWTSGQSSHYGLKFSATPRWYLFFWNLLFCSSSPNHLYEKTYQWDCVYIPQFRAWKMLRQGLKNESE